MLTVNLNTRKNQQERKDMGSQTQHNNNNNNKPHAVFIPLPAQGHINALLKLASLLHYSKGFHITFVHTDFNHGRILASGPGSLNGSAGFRFETIPDGLPPGHPRDVAALLLSLQSSGWRPFRDLVRRLSRPSSGSPPVSCIVFDAEMSFARRVAEELGVPAAAFWTPSACSYMGVLHYRHLIDRGLLPLKSDDDPNLDAPIDWIPGMSSIRMRDLPVRFGAVPRSMTQAIFHFLIDESAEASRASAIVFNTFDDLEGPVLAAMSAVLPPVYTIGPLSLLSSPPLPVESSFWKEDSSCLQWLEGREAGSVLYLNFGSLAVLTSQQMVEFAWGLANSGHDFLWVIRPDLVKGESAILPKEFETETSGRGMLSSWCPQEAVLKHPAIGGFLTHCGWNSTMESISSGVPMICWPLGFDQQTNCRYSCTEWGIGLEMDGVVKRGEVERLIRELMGGEKEKEMRRRALEWKESAVRAARPGGSSFQNLDRLIDDVLIKKKNASE